VFIAETKKLDEQGRVLLPREWRKDMEEVKIINMGDHLVIKPKNKKSLLDIKPVQVDIKSSLDDWDAVKKELMKVSIYLGMCVKF